MEGKVKWFSNDKGYGFIIAETHTKDLFFHVSEYRSQEEIQAWDIVKFNLGNGRDGREIAKNVEFVARGKPSPSNKPYHGKKTTTKDREVSGAIGGAILGAFGGPVGMLIGAVIGSIMGSPKDITSTCLRCGGIGHVTAIDENFIGFQCESCKAFWKKRNKDNLNIDQLNRKG